MYLYYCSVICKTYIDKKSTGDTSGLPFICGFLRYIDFLPHFSLKSSKSTTFYIIIYFSCILWLKYGSLRNEDSVVLVNSIGALLFFTYTVVFYVFTVNKTIILRQFATVVIFIISVVSYCNYENDAKHASNTVGIICCFVTIVFIAAPCTLLLQVIRTRNTESLPFPLILTSFFVSLLWFIYGLLITDNFLQVSSITKIIAF